VPEGLRSFGRWLRPRILPSFLIAGGVAVAAFIAYRSGAEEPVTRAESASLVVAASALNVAGAALFARIGRADPKHARSAVRRLLTVGRMLGETQVRIEDETSQERGTSKEFIEAVHTELEYSKRHLRDAIDDWNDIHREALREVLAEQETDRGDRQ
jgi:hypothetical protein